MNEVSDAIEMIFQEHFHIQCRASRRKITHDGGAPSVILKKSDVNYCDSVNLFFDGDSVIAS